MTELDHARTLLFVPGHRPDRFAKAAAAGADAVVLDLEDAVGVEEKDTAREHVAEFLGSGRSAVVRINGVGTPWHAEDLAMVRQHSCAIMLPKAADPAQVAAVSRQVPAVIPLIETAAGVLGAAEICRVEGVVRPAFGSVDLAAELGVDHTDRQALLHARSALVLAAAAAELAAPLDGVTTAVHDEALLIADSAHAASLGFAGKLCIHPKQLPTVRAAFTPSAETVQWANAVLRASADGSVAVLDGQMIDKPVVDRARRILGQIPS
ncbi:HpcH/HpaI aldolase/citrate lyase family protein [Saccharopolyspora phatthalungensis]|uniref:Citrate lyase subunit beta/citryl-CoA lyase n=1 Tax=Saccharopolyspora phatthalungensis TaxID=664693 RepID=A0A840QJX8_9PSEU|nr:CoA ester lyase [Saccharopolyspora phatthalungensis]MBB5158393.1 citrate lyase subunit beta/citryl-CoA lyase [Saccharopolyspora phatthalungensis]